MKIDELKEGDWVLYKGKPVKIVDLNDGDGIIRIKTLSDDFYDGFTTDMLKNMKPFTPRCKACNWFHDFYCKWRLQIVRQYGMPDSMAYRKKNWPYCENFIPSYNFIQKYIDK